MQKLQRQIKAKVGAVGMECKEQNDVTWTHKTEGVRVCMCVVRASVSEYAPFFLGGGGGDHFPCADPGP